MQTYLDLLAAIRKAYEQLKIEELMSQQSALAVTMERQDFWNDPTAAAATSREHAKLTERIEFWESLRKDAEELVSLDALQDAALAVELHSQYEALLKRYEQARRELQFSGKYDASDVLLSIFAGAGGTDAQDWAQMLLRMYTRWAESHGIKVTTLDMSPGEEAGIKSVMVELGGDNFLYGRLKSEHGVHRLVRLSPFNADSLRQTSFARVEVTPKIASPDAVSIDEKDLKIDVYRSGGKGGQSVNTTDSAVRITHIPTAITVAIQNERSQLQNKETALTIIRSKLAQLLEEQHIEKLNELRGENEQAAWGNQIRNYVLHPYTLVKDTRAHYETNDAQSVLDGELDPIIDAYLDTHITA